MTHENPSLVRNTERRDSYPDSPEPYTDEEKNLGENETG